MASPSEIADALAEPLGNVSYHVRILRELDCLELAATLGTLGVVRRRQGDTIEPKQLYSAWNAWCALDTEGS